MWRWLLSVAVAAVLLVLLVVVVLRLDGDRSAGAVAAAAVTAVLAASAVVVTWLESRRMTAHLNRTIERLIDTESELRLLLDDLPEAVLSVDDDGVIRGANAKAAELAGRPIAELTGRRLRQLVEPARGTDLDEWLASGRSDRPAPAVTVRLPHADGATSTLVEATVDRPRKTDAGAIVRLRDVTEREERVRALEQARQALPAGVPLGTDRDGTRPSRRLDDPRRQPLARRDARPARRRPGRSHHPRSDPPGGPSRAAAAHRARLELGIADTYLLDQRYLRSDGEFVWARTRVAVTEDEGVALAITHIEDVTEQRRTAERLQWAATHDDLTGLPNRTELINRVDAILTDAAVGDIAMLFIDLDNFKAVNDSLGHGIGDTLLTSMSVRLREVVGEEAVLARFGGDEFIVVLRHPDRDPLVVAEEVRAAVRRAVVVEGTELFISSSIGVSVNDRDGVTAADLLRDADAAMYRAKARGRDCVEAFAPGTHETTVLALRMATELRRGLERGEIVPYFQPIVELTTGHVTGFEALARWLHPERGLLSPDQFLPMAEETGLIDEIGATVLSDALAQFAMWRARDLPFAEATLSVNVGTRQVVDPAFADLVAEVLGQAGIPADSLWLEITETALLADVKASTVALRNLRSLGLHLAVDDFGTGYSSLTYLKRFPVEAIKIDKGFVAGLGLDAEDTTIVEAVVNLGHSFGIAVIAEGLETPLQLSRLREMGCDRGQGYLFGRPRPANIVEAERAG